MELVIFNEPPNSWSVVETLVTPIHDVYSTDLRTL